MAESENEFTSVISPPLTFLRIVSRNTRLVHGQHYQHHIRSACFYNWVSKLDGRMDNMEAHASQAGLEPG
jgi:hypothetical protein